MRRPLTPVSTTAISQHEASGSCWPAPRLLLLITCPQSCAHPQGTWPPVEWSCIASSAPFASPAPWRRRVRTRAAARLVAILAILGAGFNYFTARPGICSTGPVVRGAAVSEGAVPFSLNSIWSRMRSSRISSTMTATVAATGMASCAPATPSNSEPTIRATRMTSGCPDPGHRVVEAAAARARCPHGEGPRPPPRPRRSTAPSLEAP